MRTRQLTYIGLVLVVGCLCWIRINQAYSFDVKQLVVAEPTDRSPPLMSIERRIMRSDIVMARAIFRIPNKEKAVELETNGNRPANANQTFRLVGVIVNDRISLALIEVSGEIKRVAAGQQIDGWKVLQVANRDALLENNNQLRRLLLDESGLTKIEANDRSSK